MNSPTVSDATLVDTSTLIALESAESRAILDIDRSTAAAIEALVLFDRVVVDGHTVDVESRQLTWLRDMEWVERANETSRDVANTYDIALSMVARLMPRRTDYPIHNRGSLPEAESQELLVETDVRHALIANPRRISPRELSEFMHREVGLRANSIVHLLHENYEAYTALAIARLFYYLALQVEREALLLLHPNKGYNPEPVGYGYSGSIFKMFDEKVVENYLDRRRQWLGDSQRGLRLPMLSRYVVRESIDRGWSIGRTIARLRSSREVELFREGMAQLTLDVEAGDHRGVDATLSELEKACEAWGSKLGAKLGSRKVTLQLALPVLQPSFDLGLPSVRRTPARKMLVLIDTLLPAV